MLEKPLVPVPTPKTSLQSARRTVLTIFVLVSIFSAGYLFGYKGYVVSQSKFPNVTITRELPQNKEDFDFSLFWQVWDTLDLKYFDKEKLIPSEMVYGAIQGMVSAVGDPYTVFLPPTENKVVQEDLKGSFQGVGIQIGFKGTQLAVIAPLPDSPAENSGVKAGDLIVGIKDEEKGVDIGTFGITLPEAVQIIRGPAGTKVNLALLREGNEDPIDVEITRATIEVPSIIVSYVGDSSEASEGNIAHIRILKFVGETKNEWDETVIEILKKPEVEAIILDVRNNPGGYLQAAVDLASDFMEVGEIVVSEEQASGAKTDFKVEMIGRLRKYKVVILVNKGSASASEILAGALRDTKDVNIVGETTFGKGTIQEPTQINGGGGLHITIAKWLTPSGYWVNEEGLVPDFEVEDNIETEEDEQLQKAIDLLQ